jgi:hypothetical protein
MGEPRRRRGAAIRSRKDQRQNEGLLDITGADHSFGDQRVPGGIKLAVKHGELVSLVAELARTGLKQRERVRVAFSDADALAFPDETPA